MHRMKYLAAILGSLLFFPVSCSTAVFVGTHVIAKLDERDVRKGDKVHALFSVMMESKENDAPLRVVGLDDLPDMMKSRETISFLLSKPSGGLDSGNSHFSYQVLNDLGGEQLIEVVESRQGGDNTIWSRYRAARSSITPEFSRMFYFGYMFQAIPYAFGIALLLYVTGRYLKRRYGVKPPLKSAR